MQCRGLRKQWAEQQEQAQPEQQLEPTVDIDDEFQSDPLASSSGQPAHRIFGKTPAEDVEMRDERKRSREEEEDEYEEAGSSTNR